MPQEAAVIQSILWNTQHFDYSIFWVGATIGDFSVQGAYDLSDQEAMSDLGEASNNHRSTIMWQALWKAQVPNKIKVFHGILFGLSCQQSLIYFPNASSL